MYGANVYIFTYVLNVRETLNEKEPSTKAMWKNVYVCEQPPLFMCGLFKVVGIHSIHRYWCNRWLFARNHKTIEPHLTDPR